MQVIEARLRSLQGQLPASSAVAARSALESRGRMACLKTLVATAVEAWPLPQMPRVPLPAIAPEAANYKLDELKEILRRHGAKVSGRKAELVERVVAGNYLEQEHAEELQKHQQACADAFVRLEAVQEERAARAARLRAVAAEAAPKAPIDSEVEAATAPIKALAPLRTQPPRGRCLSSARDCPGNGAMMNRPGNGAVNPVLKDLVNKVRKLSGLPLALPTQEGLTRERSRSPRRAVATPARAGDSETSCGCGRTFVSAASMHEHQTHSSKCPFSIRYRHRLRR